MKPSRITMARTAAARIKLPRIKVTRAISLLLIAATLASCGTLKPWVKPYERQNIADPIMNFSRDPVADAFLSHVRDAREGASGADGGAGGGCGCN